MERQMRYVAGQVISGCVQKWKNHRKCITLFLFLPSCLPFASNNTAVSGAHCVALLYCSGEPREVWWYLCLPPALSWKSLVQWLCSHLLPTSIPPILLWKKASKNKHLAKKLSWFKEEVPWIYELPFLLKYKLEREFATQLFRGQGAGVGWVGALGLLLRPEKHFASAEWLLACQDAVVFYPDSVLGKDSGCELKALVLLIIHQS